MDGRPTMPRSDRDWERFGRDDPYWAVLTSDGYRTAELSPDARDKFFDSGELHVASLFGIVGELADAGWRPRRALDFGCGVGRLLPALSDRCDEVVGVDVSQAMLHEAERNARRHGLGNVDLICDSDGLSRLEGDFDFIHSTLTFQHIEVVRGERILRTLCDRLRPEGFAVLHFVTATNEALPLRVLAAARGAFRPLHMVVNLLRGRPIGEPLMRMYLYSIPRLRHAVEDGGCIVIRELPAYEEKYRGSILVIRGPH